jgi:hypothetical protein
MFLLIPILTRTCHGRLAVCFAPERIMASTVALQAPRTDLNTWYFDDLMYTLDAP